MFLKVASVCLQVLLRQEHYDEGARQEVRVQVRLPGIGSRDAASGGRSGGVQVPERAVHVRLRACQAEPHATAGSVGLSFRSRWSLPIGVELLVDESRRQLVRRPSHGLRTRATTSRQLSALRMTRRRALGCYLGHATLRGGGFLLEKKRRIRITSPPPPSPCVLIVNDKRRRIIRHCAWPRIHTSLAPQVLASICPLRPRARSAAFSASSRVRPSDRRHNGDSRRGARTPNCA